MTRELAPLTGELRELVDAERAASATPTSAQLEGAGQRLWVTLALPGLPPLASPAAPTVVPSTPAAAAPTAAATTTTAATAATLGGAGTAALLKPLALVALVAITGAGTYLALQHRPADTVVVPPSSAGTASLAPTPVASGAATVQAPASQPAVAASQPLAKAAPAPEPHVQKSPRATGQRVPRAAARKVSGATHASTMGAERRILERARAGLARGAWSEAHNALQTHRRSYPRGALAEERQALGVLLLARQKRLPEARQAAARFHARHPRSLLWPAIERAIGR